VYTPIITHGPTFSCNFLFWVRAWPNFSCSLTWAEVAFNSDMSKGPIFLSPVWTDLNTKCRGIRYKYLVIQWLYWLKTGAKQNWCSHSWGDPAREQFFYYMIYNIMSVRLPVGKCTKTCQGRWVGRWVEDLRLIFTPTALLTLLVLLYSNNKKHKYVSYIHLPERSFDSVFVPVNALTNKRTNKRKLYYYHLRFYIYWSIHTFIKTYKTL